MALIVGEYIRSGDAYYDPATGKSYFTYLYDGKPDKTGNKPLFAFSGPGGRYVMYAKVAEFVWEPSPK